MSGTPDSRLPVCPGWMPTLVAAALNNPSMKFRRSLNGTSGSSEGPSSIAAPEPRAHQVSGLIPLAMNTTARRRGKAVAVPACVLVAPQTGIDSIHGRSIVTPAPRRNVRRETTLALKVIWRWLAVSLSGVRGARDGARRIRHTLVQELRA